MNEDIDKKLEEIRAWLMFTASIGYRGLPVSVAARKKIRYLIKELNASRKREEEFRPSYAPDEDTHAYEIERRTKEACKQNLKEEAETLQENEAWAEPTINVYAACEAIDNAKGKTIP